MRARSVHTAHAAAARESWRIRLIMIMKINRAPREQCVDVTIGCECVHVHGPRGRRIGGVPQWGLNLASPA